MRSAISITVLSFLSLAAAAVAQPGPNNPPDPAVPDALLAPPANQVPDALIPPATNLLMHALAAKEPAAAWEELGAALRPPPPPDEWQMQPPSDKEKADFFMPYVLALMDKLKDFY